MVGIDEATGQFYAFLLTEKRVANNTFLAYKRDLEQFVRFIAQERLLLEELSKKHLNLFLKQLKENELTAKSLSRKISALKLFFNFLAATYQMNNVAKALIFPKLEKTLPTYLTEQEIERLLVAANLDNSNKGLRNKVMLYLLYASGMRVSELVTVTIDQIQFDTGFVRIWGKGSKERMVPLPKNILELLRYYLEHIYPNMYPQLIDQKDGRYLFPACYDKKCKPLSRQSLWMCLKKILRKANIVKNISPHSLRHSLATHLLQKGADLRSLQMLLGHQNLATVQVYTHIGGGQLRKIYDEKHPRA